MESKKNVETVVWKTAGAILVVALIFSTACVTPLKAQNLQVDNGVLILCFHEIGMVNRNASPSKKTLYLPQSVFDQIIKQLKGKGYTFMKLSQVHDLWASGKQLPNRTVVITFDDGYESVYRYALPIAKKYKIPFTDFVIGNDINVPGYLTDQEIKTMVGTGLVEIGGHTLDHYNLKYLSDQEQEAEIKGVIEKVKNIIPGYDITSFAVPYGEYNDQTEHLLAKYGITMDVTTQYGIAYKTDDWLLLPRVYINALPAYVYYKVGGILITRRIDNILNGKLVGEPDGPPACALFKNESTQCDQVISFTGGKGPYHVRIDGNPEGIMPSFSASIMQTVVPIPFRPTLQTAKQYGTNYGMSFTVTDSLGNMLRGRKMVTLVDKLTVRFINSPSVVFTSTGKITLTADIRSTTTEIPDFFNKPTGYGPVTAQWFLDGRQIVPPKGIAYDDQEVINLTKPGKHTILVKVKDGLGEVSTASKTAYLSRPISNQGEMKQGLD